MMLKSAIPAIAALLMLATPAMANECSEQLAAVSQQLADQKCDQGTCDHPQPLAEDTGEGRLHIGYALVAVVRDPPVRRLDADRGAGDGPTVAQRKRARHDRRHCAWVEALLEAAEEGDSD